MSDDTYHPIACSLHDKLEDLAIRRQRVVITFADEGGEIHSLEDVIEDWVTRAGVEYVRMASGSEMRLDRLVSVNGSVFDAEHL